MQNWTRLYDYIHDYQRLVYDYYSKHAVAFLVTYYNINEQETIWEDEFIQGGAYEQFGDYSGIKWNKILLLPVYFIEPITTMFDGQETGYHKENETSFILPNSYGFTPLPKDVVKLEQNYLRPANNIYPLFNVTGAELSANTDKRFWKLTIKTAESETENTINQQIANTFVFFDYDKKIHTLSDAEFMTKLLSKNEELRSRLKLMYDENSGFYFI